MTKFVTKRLPRLTIFVNRGMGLGVGVYIERPEQIASIYFGRWLIDQLVNIWRISEVEIHRTLMPAIKNKPPSKTSVIVVLFC